MEPNNFNSMDTKTDRPGSRVQLFCMIAVSINALILIYCLFYAFTGSKVGVLFSEKSLGIFGSVIYGIALTLSLLSLRMSVLHSKGAKITLGTIALIPALTLIILSIMSIIT